MSDTKLYVREWYGGLRSILPFDGTTTTLPRPPGGGLLTGIARDGDDHLVTIAAWDYSKSALVRYALGDGSFESLSETDLPTSFVGSQDRVLYRTGVAGIERVDLATGERTPVAGGTIWGEQRDGVGEAAGFGWLGSLALDEAAGVLYVADWMRSTDETIGTTTIRAIDLATRAVTTVPRQVAPYSSVFAADQQGHLFVVDNGRVLRRIDLATMTSTTLLGDEHEAGVRLGELSQARLNNVTGIAVLPDGDLVLADHGENVVLRVRLPR